MAVRGSASIDTGRFANKDKEFEKKLTFSSTLKQKVNMKKVVFPAMKPWIKEQIDSILGFEDDVVINLIYNLLEKDTHPDARAITVKLMGFLEGDTMEFMNNLWNHLLDANQNELGIPTKLLADAQKRSKLKKEGKLQNAERYKLKKEIEQNTATHLYKRSYDRKPRGRGRGRGRGRNNDYSHRYKQKERNYKRDRNEYEYKPKCQEKEVRDSMNSIWPPSPSPPPILLKLKKMKRERDASPSPPKELKGLSDPTDRDSRSRSPSYDRSKRDKRKRKRKQRKRRRKRSYSRDRRSSSRSYSRSRSRSRSSRSRSRSSSRSRSTSRSRSRDRGRWRKR